MRTLVVPLHHLDGAPNPTLIQSAGLRGGVATGNRMRTLIDNYHDCELLNRAYTSE